MLYVGERLDCTGGIRLIRLTIGDVVTESLWVGIKGMDSKANVVLGMYC